MTAESRRPIEVFSSKRRASTANSTGLDYSTGYRVEEDILSRIRSLLLSRNGHRPPRTPYTSDEDRNRCSEHCCTTDTSDRFDFSSAKSIRRLLVRTESGGISFPVTPHLRSRSTTLKMDGARRPTQPSIPVQKRSLRAASSTNDLTSSLDDATLHAAFLPCCPPCPPEETKKTSRLPRLVLRDKIVKRKRDPHFRSCIDFTTRPQPAADASSRNPDINCCSPNTSPNIKPWNETDPPQHLSGKFMKAEPTDLACFLSGCGPGECNVHRRRSSQPVSPREKNTAKAIDQDVADKIENLGLTVMAVNQVSGVVHHPRSDSKETSQNVIRRRPNETETKQRDPVNASPILKSNPSSVYSLDTFPHAVQSQEVAAKGTSKEPLSSVVVTNFSLPGPKAKNNQTKDATETDQFDVSLPKASDSVRFKSPVVSLSRIVESGSASPSDASTGRVTDSAQTKSAASLKTKNYSPSLRSVSSKAASIRHALLKPPDTDVEPADIALPVPPVLTQVDVRSLDVPVTNGKILKETTVDGSANEDSEILTALNAAESAATEVVVHLTSLKKARDLADRIKNRSETTGTTVQYPPKASESTSQQVSKSDNKDKLAAEIASKSITSLKGLLCNSNSAQQPPGNFYGEDSSKPECYPAPANESHHNESGRDPGKSTCPPGLVSQPPQSIPLVNSVNAVYWGFVPTVKEAVQDAFQISVRKAVEEIIVPPGSRKDEAAEAYRKLVADSLTAAAKDADRYLRRASLLNEPPSIIRERSEDDPEFPESTTTGLEPLMGGAATDHPGLSSDSKPPETSQDNLDTVPLETVDERLVENHKQGWKVDGAWNGLAKKRSSGYAVIPTRSSSKSRFLGSKPQSTPESSVKESPKSFRKPRSKAIGGLRSISSVGSDDRLEADERDSTAQEIVDRKTHRSSVGKQSSAGKLGRRNTIHWLRELLSTNGPYEPRFTALPPRTRRDENASTGRIRSQTAPAVPIPGLYLGATPRPDQSKPGILNQRDTSKGDIVISMPENGDEQTTAMTKAFTKTISDLEFLLNEALFIARQAAEKEGRGYGPKLLGKAAAVLKGGRKVFEDDAVRRRTLKTRHQSRRQGQKRSDDVSSVPSMHESFGSFSSSDSEDINEVEDVEKSQSHSVPIPELRLKTPTVGILVSTELTQTTHRDAGWSPPGRVPTPFPPGSIAHSRLEAGEQSSRFESPAGESGGEDPDPELPCVRIKDVNPFLAENVGNWRKISQISPTKRSRSTTGCRSQQTASCALDDLALAHCNSRSPSGQLPMPAITPRGASLTKAGKRRATQTDPELINANFTTESVPSKQEVREYIRAFHHPPIQARESPLKVREQAEMEQTQAQDAGRAPTGNSYSWQNIYRRAREPCSQEEEIPDPAQIGTSARAVPDHDKATSISKSYDGSQSEAIHFDTGFAHRQHGGGDRVNGRGRRDSVELRDTPNPDLPQITNRGGKGSRVFDLKGRNHISLRGEHHKGFSFARTHKKPKIARDWAPARKRFVATVACISTALVGSLVGVYAAEVPAIQYWIVDFHHYTILGNVFFFIGLSIPTFFFWPLPLLHGRKPYTLGAMSLAMPLLFPQALAVGQVRSPYVDYWRVGLIFSRALMGFVLGFANMNFKATLLDLFGASLQSENPHQEVVDENDVRRHGGGLGVWLGIWTWCAMGSIGIGFLIGAIIINHGSPAWGFYISIAIIAFVLLLNVICPEVRRSAFRRSVAELRHEEGVSRRLGRGEVKMHMVHTGPKWWGEEFHYGVKMNAKMLRQPGFMVLALYVSWIYGQVVLLVVLLGSLLSNSYKLKSPYVGASVMAVPVGAFLAIPFQKASLLSRSRGNAELEDNNAETLNKKVTFSSHLVRRAVFILCLPLAGLGYTLSSNGPPIPFIVPILFAGLIGFLSNLAMGECHGIIMETFDTSDLQPGMTGRPRGASGDKNAGKRTNYSSFPRVSSGFAITQGIGYLFAAAATGVGGVAARGIGQQGATGVMAGILLVLSLLLLGVLYRFRDVQIIPISKQDEMQKWKNARRTSAILRAEGIEQPEEWRPIIIGNPTHTMRRMCVLEMGGMTRWSEIRRKNHLVDQNTLEARHPNLAVIRDVEHRIKAAEEEIIHHVRRSISRHSLSRNSSRRSKRSDRSYDQQADLGGHREMLHASGNASRKRERGKSRIQE